LSVGSGKKQEQAPALQNKKNEWFSD